jgi:ATP-binding cassette subfamily B protein
MSFTSYKQHDQKDCGPTCLRMVAKHYGRSFSIQKLREATQIGKEGVSLLGISEAAESTGFKTLAVKVPFKQLEKEAPLPCIVHWKQNHFVVVAPNPQRGLFKSKQKIVLVADPALGLIKYTHAELTQRHGKYFELVKNQLELGN